LLSQGIASGIGMGLIFVPTVSVLAQNFLKKRALVMGIAVTGSSLGGVIFPIFMGRMLDRYPFPTAYRNVTYLMTAVALFINLTVTSKPITPRPAAAGAKPNPFSFLKERRYSLAVAGSFFIAL
jgi:MFS family permease